MWIINKNYNHIFTVIDAFKIFAGLWMFIAFMYGQWKLRPLIMLYESERNNELLLEIQKNHIQSRSYFYPQIISILLWSGEYWADNDNNRVSQRQWTSSKTTWHCYFNIIESLYKRAEQMNQVRRHCAVICKLHFIYKVPKEHPLNFLRK